LHLCVVLHLARLHELRVELLAVIVMSVVAV